MFIRGAYKFTSVLVETDFRKFFTMASASKTTTTNSDLAFNKQADAARDALKNFNTIAQLNAPGLIKSAMDELIMVMVSPLFITSFIQVDRDVEKTAFNSFVPHYVVQPPFQELPLAALDAINLFTAKHPSYKLPKTFPNLVGLVARVKDTPVSAAKKGKPNL
jgi:hypothetical protein